MKNFTLIFLCTLLHAFISVPQLASAQGFASVTHLNPTPIAIGTQDKPQAKVWKHAGKWWCILADAEGTKIFRLDGTTWTPVLKLVNNDAKADHWVVGSVVHVLLYKGGGNNSYLYSIEYDAAADTYKLWNERRGRVTLVFPEGTETATLAVDGKSRMWIAYAGKGDVNVRWSDVPYTNWSTPVVIAKGVKDDDICAVTKLQNKIGVLWSNQRKGLFGFKTHNDDSDPANWSDDEVPASQSAINNLPRMADDHINLKVTSNGTLYCAVKTSYNTSSYPLLALMVRRPNGNWDRLYRVTSYESGGTQPMVIINEAKGKIKVVYTTVVNGGDIVYKESALSNIAFGDAKTLIGGGGALYNFATSSHQTYNDDVVVLATNVSTSPYQATGILASDGDALPIEPSQSSLNSLLAFPNPSSSNTTLTFNLAQGGPYSLNLYDSKGVKVSELHQGIAKSGEPYTIKLDGTSLTKGVYFIILQTEKEFSTLKLMLVN